MSDRRSVGRRRFAPSLIDEAALVELVRVAMAAALIRARDGRVDVTAPLGHAFGDFPRQFLSLRPSLVDALIVADAPTELETLPAQGDGAGE